MSGINMLVWPIFVPIVNGFMKLVYGLYFGIVKAVAWILDVLTQLFFIFSGMTPVGAGTTLEDGTDVGVDIVNFFLTQDAFQKAYLYLCGVALALIVVFTIAKIIKQDYFEKSGPRSKGPIFRSVALSFIAFICIIPVFYFLITAVGALALLVMKAMGYNGGGIGTMLFEISWSDNGKSIIQLGQEINNSAECGLTCGRVYERDNFGWYPGEVFYQYYWDASVGEAKVAVGEEFYWWVFFLAGGAILGNLLTMVVAMVTRLFNLIALFIVAPAPISQIVLDDGVKFKGWKDQVVQEALKVVGCVMSFMLFMLIASAVRDIDLMKFAYSEFSASAKNIVDTNDMVSELSYDVNFLYHGGDEMSSFDKMANALGKAVILIAGAGAIKDIDSVVTKHISGGSSSMSLGSAGDSLIGKNGALTAAGGALASAAGKVGGLVGKATGKVVGATGGSIAKGLGSFGGSVAKGYRIDKDANNEKENKEKMDLLNKAAGDDKAEVPTSASAPTSPAGGGDSKENNEESENAADATENGATPVENPVDNNSQAEENKGANETDENAADATENGATPVENPAGEKEGKAGAPSGLTDKEQGKVDKILETRQKSLDKAAKKKDKETKKNEKMASRGKFKRLFGEVGKGLVKGSFTTLGSLGKSLGTSVLSIGKDTVATAWDTSKLLAKTATKIAGYGFVADTVTSVKEGVVSEVKGSYKKTGGVSGGYKAAIGDMTHKKMKANRVERENKLNEKADEIIANRTSQENDSKDSNRGSGNSGGSNGGGSSSTNASETQTSSPTNETVTESGNDEAKNSSRETSSETLESSQTVVTSASGQTQQTSVGGTGNKKSAASTTGSSRVTTATPTSSQAKPSGTSTTRVTTATPTSSQAKPGVTSASAVSSATKQTTTTNSTASRPTTAGAKKTDTNGLDNFTPIPSKPRQTVQVKKDDTRGIDDFVPVESSKRKQATNSQKSENLTINVTEKENNVSANPGRSQSEITPSNDGGERVIDVEVINNNSKVTSSPESDSSSRGVSQTPSGKKKTEVNEKRSTKKRPRDEEMRAKLHGSGELDNMWGAAGKLVNAGADIIEEGRAEQYYRDHGKTMSNRVLSSDDDLYNVLDNAEIGKALEQIKNGGNDSNMSAADYARELTNAREQYKSVVDRAKQAADTYKNSNGMDLNALNRVKEAVGQALDIRSSIVKITRDINKKDK